MKKFVSIFFIVVAGLLTLNCQESKKAAVIDIGSQTPDGPTVVTEVEGVTAGSPLFVKVGLAWETDSSSKYAFSAPCFFSPGSVVGDEKDCTFTIPEAKLFYSRVNFRMGSLDPVNCGRIVFEPYYFQRSNRMIANAFDPSLSEIDCSANPTNPKDAGCWGGAAPILLGADWPLSKAKYFFPTTGNQNDYIIDSSNTVRHLGTGVNWMITNDLTDRVTGYQATANADPTKPTIVGANERLPNQFNDYFVSCVDIWGESQFKMRLIISDENTVNSVNGSVLDTYTDWDNSP